MQTFKVAFKLTTLKPRVQTLGSRLPTLAPGYGYEATPRQRGRVWMRRRSMWLRAHPLCLACQSKGRVEAATQVDHVVPLWKGGADHESNYQSLCEPCHKDKTALEAAERGQFT